MAARFVLISRYKRVAANDSYFLWYVPSSGCSSFASRVTVTQRCHLGYVPIDTFEAVTALARAHLLQVFRLQDVSPVCVHEDHVQVCTEAGCHVKHPLVHGVQRS